MFKVNSYSWAFSELLPWPTPLSLRRDNASLVLPDLHLFGFFLQRLFPTHSTTSEDPMLALLSIWPTFGTLERHIICPQTLGMMFYCWNSGKPEILLCSVHCKHPHYPVLSLPSEQPTTILVLSIFQMWSKHSHIPQCLSSPNFLPSAEGWGCHLFLHEQEGELTAQ